MKRALVAAGAVALALSLAACSEDEPEPKIAPPESTSPSTPDPSPTPPPEKEPWEKNTRAGAVAFVKHWFEVFSDSMDDGDVADLREMSAPKCESCAFIADRTESIYANAGFYECDGWEIRSYQAVPQQTLPRNTFAMTARVLRNAERFKESATAEVVTNPASTATYEIRAEWVQGRWLMERVVILS